MLNDDSLVQMGSRKSCTELVEEKEDRGRGLGRNLTSEFDQSEKNDNLHLLGEQIAVKETATSLGSGTRDQRAQSFSEELDFKRLKVIQEANEKQKLNRRSRQAWQSA